MCGSYSIVPGDKFYQRFAPVNRLVILKPNYNVKPGYMMPVITGNRLISSYTIITTVPNGLVAPIHNRMPVILVPSPGLSIMGKTTVKN